MFTERRRQLIFRLADNHPDALMWIHSLEPYRKRDEMYKWLLANGFTGKKLVEMFKQLGFSHLQVSKFVLTQIEKSPKEEIYVGKDIL